MKDVNDQNNRFITKKNQLLNSSSYKNYKYK